MRLPLLLVIFLALIPGQARALDPLCADANEVKFLSVINEYRAAHGVAPLVLSRSLTWAANNHAAYMAETDDVDHTLGDLSWADNIWSFGYPGPWIGENVLAGRQSAGGALALFASSPTHNAVMLNPLWKSIGISRVVNKEGRYVYYWSTEFGSERHRTVTCV